MLMILQKLRTWIRLYWVCIIFLDPSVRKLKGLWRYFVASYRGIDFHGKDIGVSWTKLAATANAGDTTIDVQDDVTLWADVVSDRELEIIVTTTSNKMSDTEEAVIQSVSGNTITLREPLKNRHISKFFLPTHHQHCRGHETVRRISNVIAHVLVNLSS